MEGWREGHRIGNDGGREEGGRSFGRGWGGGIGEMSSRETLKRLCKGNNSQRRPAAKCVGMMGGRLKVNAREA